MFGGDPWVLQRLRWSSLYGRASMGNHEWELIRTVHGHIQPSSSSKASLTGFAFFFDFLAAFLS